MKHLIAVIFCLASVTSTGVAQLDLYFADESAWTNDRANWTGAVARWEWESFRVVNALVAKAENQEIRRTLPEGDGPLHVAINYGWRSGRLEGMGQLVLVDEGRDAKVVINLGQAAVQKHQVTLQVGNGQPQVLGNIERDAIDAGYTTGGLVDQYAMHIRLDGRSLRVARSDVPDVTGAIELPADFTPSHLALRSLSAGEMFSVQRLRAFRGARDPVVEVQPLHLPFGAMFVEGKPIDLRISGRWYTSEQRDYAMRLSVQRHLPTESEPIAIERQGQLSPIEPMPVDLPELSALPAGLYRVSGTLRIDGREREMSARFAVVSSELAARPTSEIPRWVGMMPYLNLLPQDRYAPGFELMELLGVRHVRFLPGWGRIEPVEGEYDWREADHFVELCQKHGITAMFCFSYYGPPWTVAKSKGQRAFTPEGRALWVERFAVPTMRRYGDRVKEYQIWNEPDAFWDDDPAKARGFAAHFGTPANYFDLVKRTHAASRELGIEGVKVMASLSSANQATNLRRLFDMGLGEFFDGIIIHTYGNHYRHFERAREILKNRGFPDATIGSGEIGIPTAKTMPAEMLQGTRVATVMLSSACFENVSGVNWFVLTRVAHPMFGLIDEQFHPQPGTIAFFTVARLLSGATGATMTEAGDLRTFRVERQGRPPLVAVVVSRQTSVNFQAQAGAQPVVWDLWGGRSEPQVVDGRFAVPTRDVVFVEGDVALDAVLVADVLPVMTDGRPAVRIAPGGKFPDDAAVRVALRVPSLNVDLTREFENVAQLRDAAIELPATTPAQVYPLQVDLSVGRQQVTIDGSVEFTPIHRVSAEQAAAIDAPDGAVRIKVSGDAMFQTLGHGRYFGPDDSSAELAFGYTDTDLVLWIKQTDDVHVPVQLPNPWGFDGPQWAIASHAGSDANFVEITFGIGKDNEMFARVMGQPHYSPTLKADRSGTTTRYRVSIPLSQLDIEPTTGRAIATTVLINDNDGDGRKGWLGWGAGVGEEKNAARFRTLILAGEIKQASKAD